MKMAIIWSPEILQDLEHLATYLKEEWPNYVLKNFESALNRKIDLLATDVIGGRPISHNPSVSSILISKHNKLYYTIADNTLCLLRLWDTRQNPARNPFE